MTSAVAPNTLSFDPKRAREAIERAHRLTVGNWYADEMAFALGELSGLLAIEEIERGSSIYHGGSTPLDEG